MEDTNMYYYSYFVELLKSALNGTVPGNIPDDFDWNKLYKLAERHSVASTVYYGIMQLPKEKRPDNSVMQGFKKASQVALGMGLRQELELGNVMNVMASEGIGYIPLKGWHMKKLYPSPDMRYMCDVDILIDKNDRDKIPSVMKKCGFEFKESGVKDDCYQKDGVISVEIHRLLFEEISEYYGYFENYYSKAVEYEEDGGRSCERVFSKEDFLIYMLAHMAKHYKGSGIGIRSVMDIYIYNKAYSDGLDWGYVERELGKIGLKGFLHSTLELAEDMFGRESEDMFRRHQRMAMHILMTGMYGDRETLVRNSMAGKYNSKLSYVFHRVFLDSGSMKSGYPCLNRLPFLLPVFWGVRLVRIMLFSRNNVKCEFSALRAMDNSEKECMAEIMKDSGLM